MANEEMDSAFLKNMQDMLSSTGAGDLMGSGGGAQQQNLLQLLALQQLLQRQGAQQGPLVQPNPVGGPGPGDTSSLAPNYGPRGTIFLGGSPFKPDFGPARTQNSLALLQNLLSEGGKFSESDMGQALGAKLKALFGGAK